MELLGASSFGTQYLHPERRDPYEVARWRSPSKEMPIYQDFYYRDSQKGPPIHGNNHLGTWTLTGVLLGSQMLACLELPRHQDRARNHQQDLGPTDTQIAPHRPKKSLCFRHLRTQRV